MTLRSKEDILRRYGHETFMRYHKLPSGKQVPYQLMVIEDTSLHPPLVYDGELAPTAFAYERWVDVTEWTNEAVYDYVGVYVDNYRGE